MAGLVNGWLEQIHILQAICRGLGLETCPDVLRKLGIHFAGIPDGMYKNGIYGSTGFTSFTEVLYQQMLNIAKDTTLSHARIFVRAGGHWECIAIDPEYPVALYDGRSRQQVASSNRLNSRIHQAMVEAVQKIYAQTGDPRFAYYEPKVLLFSPGERDPEQHLPWTGANCGDQQVLRGMLFAVLTNKSLYNKIPDKNLQQLIKTCLTCKHTVRVDAVKFRKLIFSYMDKAPTSARNSRRAKRKRRNPVYLA